MRPPCAPAHLFRMKTWSGKLGSNQRPLDYRSSAQPTELFPDAISHASVELRARIELASPLYRSGASPAMLAGPKPGASGANRALVGRLALGEPYRATAVPLSYTGWSRRADSNRHLSFTRAPFFPLNYFDMERVTGFEPVSGPWQGPILAARRYPHGASGKRTWCALIGSRRTLRASLEGWNSANKSH